VVSVCRCRRCLQFHLLRGEQLAVVPLALEGARVKVAAGGVFDESSLTPSLLSAFVKDCALSSFSFSGGSACVMTERGHQQTHAPGGEVDLIVSGRAGDDASKSSG